MKKFKYFIAGVTVVAVSLCMFCGCYWNKNEDIAIYDTNIDAKETKISFFGYNADSMNLAIIEDSIHDFTDKNSDIKVSYEGINVEDYWNAFNKRIDSDRLDDVFMIDHDHVVSMSEEGSLVNLSDLDVAENFSETAKEQFLNDDGSIYFLPTCISSYGLYINYDLLTKYNQKIPTNWKEFSQVCNYFAKKGITPIIANNYTSLRALIIAKSMYPVYQQDDPSDLIEKFNNGEENINKYLSTGIDMAAKIIDKGWIDCNEALKTDPTSDDIDIFTEGNRPFMITGSWAASRVSAKEPDFEYGVYPFPILDDGGVLVYNADTCLSVNADSDNINEAKKFVSYLTQPKVIQNYCESQSSFSPLKDSEAPSDKTVSPTVEYYTNGRSVIGSDYRLKLPLDTILLKCSKKMLKGMNAENAKEYVRKLVDDSLKN